MTHQGRQITLKGVLYHPKFYNLISGQKIGDHTTNSVGPNMEVQLLDGNLLYKIERDANGTMWIKPDRPNGPTNNQPTKGVTLKINKVTLQDLHERYRHISYSSLLSLLEAKKVIDLENRTCNACLYRKSTQPASKTQKPIRTKRTLERIYADLIGPLPKQWLGKSYILRAIDDYSRFCTAIPIRDKSEGSEKPKE